MASKKKLDLKKYAAQSSGRREAFREERKYYLIVCEGEKTEPNYFEGLKSRIAFDAPARVEIKIFGEGYNTTSLLEKAIERKVELERNSTRKIDKIWVVFDRDSFPKQAFNATITSCTRKGVDIAAAWTNEAFELWYLLHFEYYDTGLTRYQYKQKIEAHFKKAGYKDFKYEKNNPKMFELLGDDRRKVAIRNATKLKAKHTGKDHAKHNPCTTVHELVIELFKLAEK